MASCICALREKIINTMLERANIAIGREDVIANKGKGYHFSPWIDIEEYDYNPDFPSQSAPKIRD